MIMNKGEKIIVSFIIILLSLMLTACTQSFQNQSEVEVSENSHSTIDMNLCKNFLGENKDIESNLATLERINLTLVLRKFAAYWALIDDENLQIALRDLHNMTYDFYNDVLDSSGEIVGSTPGRSRYAVLQEFDFKRETVKVRCQYILQDPRLEENPILK